MFTRESILMTSLVLAVALTLVTVLGLLLNGYILLVIVLTKQVQTANNLLLLHLGIVDTLLCSLFLIFSAPGMFRGLPGWLGLSAPCTLHGFLFTLLHPMALWTLCGLNCDRYFAISAPLHYGAVVNSRKVIMGLSAAWVLALVLSLPPLFLVAPYRYNSGMAGCAPDFGFGDGALWYTVIYTLLTLLLPAALILGCNIKVLMIARYHRHRIASAIFEVTLSAQVTITHQRNPFAPPPVLNNPGAPRFLRSRSAISSVLQLLGSFLILYFPYYSLILWDSSANAFSAASKVNSARIHPILLTVASTLLTCSPPVNGLLYGVKSKVLRKTFQNYWRKQMSKSEMNQEIQARTPSACGSRRPSLTPLGMMTRPGGQRRLSDVLLDPQRNGNRAHIQRIASELNWRQASTPGLSLISLANLLPRSRSFKDRISHKTASCNTLQVPTNDGELAIIEDDDAKSFRRAAGAHQGSLEGSASLCGNLPQTSRGFSSANLFLQRVFGAGNDAYQKEISAHAVKRAAAIQTVLASTPRRSPRILITRAFSEESESPPTPGTPAKGHMGRPYSTSTNSLIDRKWKRYRYQETNVEDYSESSRSDSLRQQHLDILKSVSSSVGGEGNNSSCSSTDEEGSEASSGRLYFSMDGNSGVGSVPLACDEIALTGDIYSDSCGMHDDDDDDDDDDMHEECNEKDSEQRDEVSSSYILSWPTTRRKYNNIMNKDVQGANASQTRVLMARSFTDITNPPEFVL